MKSIFPTAVNPPKITQSYGPMLGYVAAGIAAVFAIMHLFRIDTLIPIVNAVLPGGSTQASLFVIFVLLAEVFAIPFLLRMKLSPLAHILSGFLAILGPLMWTLIAVWAYSTEPSTGQLGQFVATPSTWVLIFLNLLWLTFVFTALWALGYNDLKINAVLARPIKKSPKA